MVFEEKSKIKEESSFSFGDFFSSENGIRAVYLFVGFVVIGLVFYKLQYSTKSVCCGDYDGYYHIRWSRLLWENFKSGHIFPPAFTWLPLTTLNPNDYVDHHYLFHILQIPFTWFFELTTAAKLAAIFFSTLALFSCYWLIVRYQINYALLWLLALLTCSTPIIYRMSMANFS
jgi:asparagine N-glycosylation enzyme membrane subunit Stt3